MTWTVDFSGVPDTLEVPSGEYVAQVKNITQEMGNYPYLKWELVILSGAAKGLHINHITTLKPDGLFNLRNTLIACGLNVPKSAVRINPKDIIGRKLGIVVGPRPSKDDPTVTFQNVLKVKPASEIASGVATPRPATLTSPPSVSDIDTTIITSNDL